MTAADGEVEPVLAFAELRQANVERCKLWHPGFPNDGLWDARHWLNAVLGEVGEVANVVKKLHRHEIGTPGALDAPYEDLLDHLADELVDVICYGDLYCAFKGWEWRPRRRIVAFAPAERDDATDICLEMGASIGSAILARDDVQARRHVEAVVAACQQLAGFYAIDLAGAVVRKFNRVSERQGFPQRLLST